MKGVDLICELSLLSLLCTNLSGTSQTHIWGENCCLCVSVCVSLKCSTFHWPEYTLSLCAGKTTCGGGSTTRSISTPLYCSFFPPCSSSLAAWYHFTGSPDFPESPRGHVAHLLTSLPLELREISPDIGLRLPAVILTSHLLKTETKSGRRCAI